MATIVQVVTRISHRWALMFYIIWNFQPKNENCGAGVSTSIKESSAPRALTTILLALYFAIHH
jgi:hypothetical protein